MDPRAARDGDPGETGRRSPTPERHGGRKSAQARTRLNASESVADAIGRAEPFRSWPRDVLLRLATASSVCSHACGTALIVKGARCDQITIIAEGTVLTSASTPDGRSLTYKIDRAAFAYGLAALADGLPLQVDVVADGSVSAVRVPIAAVRAELARMPALWESVAVETIRRSRRYARQLNQLVLDAPRVRAASLLTGLLAKSGKVGLDGAAAIDFRLSQERLADMLGVSRQWATAVVRELTQAGLVEWRYGRVRVLDAPALRRLAAQGVEAAVPHDERRGPRPSADRASVLAADASGAAAAGGAGRRPN